jgi:hypothetical protein
MIVDPSGPRDVRLQSDEITVGEVRLEVEIEKVHPSSELRNRRGGEE